MVYTEGAGSETHVSLPPKEGMDSQVSRTNLNSSIKVNFAGSMLRKEEGQI